MEIYQLRAFVTVAKIGHLTRAAEVLHVTQPAVTGPDQGAGGGTGHCPV
jgi:DNA-binding transcriptional LysR family regulator